MTDHRSAVDVVIRAMSGVVLLLMTAVAEAQETEFSIDNPKPWQVFQRTGFDPGLAGSDAWTLQKGSASVPISGRFSQSLKSDSILEVRVVEHDKPPGDGVQWSRLSLQTNGTQFYSAITVPAGGWYRLDVRINESDRPAREPVSVSHFGVGEVFLIAGQSYATNTNDERLTVGDPRGRVVALDTVVGTWAIANDPQPTPDGSDGGSIWPAVGDLLTRELDVPIAFANVAVGGTASAQWLPEGSLYPGLVRGGQSLRRFRAVLWQQGESDVIAKTTVEAYLENLQRIRKSAVRAWGFEPVWLAAQSTLHPTVYNDPEGEGRIRSAIEELWGLPGFGQGPDTDKLTGENRGDANSRRHFSAIGQRRAAEMWKDTLLQHLRKVPRGVEAASFLLQDMHLLTAAWESEIVHRESCVLRQADATHPVSAALAFEATEILQITTADRMHQYEPGVDFETAADGKSLIFRRPEPLEPIEDADLYLPAGAPNSYKHRVGNPEQNLLYRPGRWFHDHNIEVTYRRNVSRKKVTDTEVTYGDLPKTLTRLAAGEPLTIGISGDSISTGLDASLMTAAPPFQPGYPELVVAQLHVQSDSQIKLVNRAVAGWSVANGLEDLDALLAEKPHLIIVAYGMNDVGRRDPKWFSEQTQAIIAKAKTANPDIEILLVSTMLGNKEWIHTPRDMFASYRDELKLLVSPGVAMADVTEVWNQMLAQKPDFDLTGNGLNHPNDFGHRLYAQAILKLLSRIRIVDLP